MTPEQTKQLLDKWSDDAWAEEMQTDLEAWAEYQDSKVDWDSYLASEEGK